MVFSPLEQFQILSFIPFFLGGFDFSLTNATLVIIIGLTFIMMILSSILLTDGSFYILPSR